VALSKKIFLSTGASFSYYRFKKTTMIAYPNNNSFDASYQDIAIKGVTLGEQWGTTRPTLTRPISEADRELIGRTTYMTVQVPVLAGIRVHHDKIGLKAGAVTSFVVRADSHRYNFASVEKYDAKGDFNTVTAGAMVEVDYLLTSHLSAGLSGQKFFSALYEKDFQQGGKAKLNALSLNVSYRVR
jgi:hypothetical protein